MKKLVAFAMILSLGLFCAVGCTPEKKPPTKPPATTSAKETEKAPAAGATKTTTEEKPGTEVPK